MQCKKKKSFEAWIGWLQQGKAWINKKYIFSESDIFICVLVVTINELLYFIYFFRGGGSDRGGWRPQVVWRKTMVVREKKYSVEGVP